MLVVTMTSWVKRIHNVKPVVESIMKNTLLPDRVYLNLSETEFDDIELPQDLVDYFNSDDRLIINWVAGENTKSMKKIFPILQYLKDDDIIIDADDDILFPCDLISCRVNDFTSHNCKYSISSNTSTSIGFNKQMKIVNATSLFQKKMFNNWEKFVNQQIIQTYNDDRTYLTLLWLNGYLNKECTKWNIKELLNKCDIKAGCGMKENHVHLIGKAYDEVSEVVVQNITNLSLNSAFGKLQ